MKIAIRRFILLFAAVVALQTPVETTAADKVPVWEIVETTEPEVGTTEDNIDLIVRDGFIFITTPRPVEARVYTILGQLVTKKKIPAGTVRLSLGLRGVYILKTDTLTRRINL